MPDFNDYTKTQLEYEVANPSGPGLGEEAAIHLEYRNNLIAYAEDCLSKANAGIGSNPPSNPPPPPGV